MFIVAYIILHVYIVEDICPEVSFNSERSSTCITALFVEQIRLLTKLNVSGYNITDQGVALMATILMETVSLAKLDLSNTMLNSVKATTVISALKNNSSLKVFNISHNDIDDGAAESITAVISSNSKIQTVNLSHNKLSYNGVLKIVSLLPKGITTIDISGNLITCDNIADLATALSNCPVLQQLRMSENLLSLTNVLTIAQYFRNHPTLQSLDLSGNSISFSSACEFIIGIVLSVNQKLVNINVCGKNIRPRCTDHLSPPKNDINFNTLMLQNIFSSQRSSFHIQTSFIKVSETCSVFNNDIISYYVDNRGGTFYNQHHNFAIVIPPGAVTQGDCVEIQGTANYFSPYVIPDGFYPISSYYWVSANYVFKSPVYLIMSHYAKIGTVQDIDNLHVLHKCAHDGATVRDDDLIMGAISDGVYFDNDIGYCVLATDHFCSYCQAKDVRHIPEYLTACYCTYDEPSIGSLIAEVCFCPSSTECIKVHMICYHCIIVAVISSIVKNLSMSMAASD